MLYWKSFSEQAQMDLRRAKNLFDIGDYGFSAYCAQQALEKYVKSYFYRLDLIDNNDPSRFGHLPIIAIISDIKSRLNNMEHKHRNNKLFLNMLRPMFLLLKPIIDLFQEMKKREQKILWWKYSLKIPVTSNIYDDTMNMMLKSVTKFSNAFNIYNNQQFIPNLDKIQEQFSKNDFERILTLRDDMKGMSEAAVHMDLNKMIQNKEAMENESKLLERFNELQKNDKDLSKVIQGDMKRLMAYTKILIYSETIMKSFPHEDIGRYPTEIDENESTVLYGKQKDSLLILINEISDVCNTIKIEIDSQK